MWLPVLSVENSFSSKINTLKKITKAIVVQKKQCIGMRFKCTRTHKTVSRINSLTSKTSCWWHVTLFIADSLYSCKNQEKAPPSLQNHNTHGHRETLELGSNFWSLFFCICGNFSVHVCLCGCVGNNVLEVAEAVRCLPVIALHFIYWGSVIYLNQVRFSCSSSSAGLQIPCLFLSSTGITGGPKDCYTLT